MQLVHIDDFQVEKYSKHQRDITEEEKKTFSIPGKLVFVA